LKEGVGDIEEGEGLSAEEIREVEKELNS